MMIDSVLTDDVLDDIAKRVSKLLRPPRNLRIERVAWELDVSRAHAYKLIASGEIPSFRIGKSRRVRKQDLDAYIKAQLEGTR
jgi:excisionase family DNA binding protein